MIRLIPGLAVLLAALALAPAAGAAMFTVNLTADTGDTDAVPEGACDNDAGTMGDQCTLREAIEEANANTVADTITFAPLAGPIDVSTPLTVGPASCPALADCKVTISDDGDVTIREIAGTGLLRVLASAQGTKLQSVRLTRTGGTGPLLQIEASSTEASGLTVSAGAGDGVVVGGNAQTVSLPSLSSSGNGGDGLEVGAGVQGVTVTAGTLTGNTGAGARVLGGAQDVTLSTTRVSGNGGDGVSVAGQGVVVTRSPVFGNTLEPISLAGGANGGIAPPQGLRVGPRRADGTLPITGTTEGGSVEIFRGDPAGTAAIDFLAEVAGGSFLYLPSPEPAPGAVFSATVRNPGTSEFATTVVPSDVVSPDLAGAVATSTSEVRVQASEPLDPGGLQPEDFVLEMAGQRRTVTGVRLEGSGTQVVLGSSGWTHGEAGFVQLAAAGSVADAAGNASLATTRFRVAAAPGDFLAPIGSSLAIRPRRICLTKAKRCRRTGATVNFIASEPGRAKLVILRGNKRVGVDTALSEAGRNRVRFNGRLRGRKLRAGSYRMLLYLEDPVGNETVEPPIQRFQVLRATGRR